MNTKCEDRDVYSSILQAHRRFINSEHFKSDSYQRTFERTYEHSYQSNYESNVSSDKTIGNISSSTDHFIISNEDGLEPKQNKTQVEDFSDGDRSYGKIQKRRIRSKSTRPSKGARRDREPSRLPWKKIVNIFNKNKAIKRYVRSHIVHSVPQSSALKKILWCDYRNYLKTRMSVEVNQFESLLQKVQSCILLLIVFMFSKQELRTYISIISYLSWWICTCFSMSLNIV